MLHESVAIVAAETQDYPAQLYVLEGSVFGVLDAQTGITHTYWTQYRDNAGEPRFIAFIQGLIHPDPTLGKPPAGRRAWKYVSQFDAAMRDETDPSTTNIPTYVRNSYWKNLGRAQQRERDFIGATRDDTARIALQQALPGPRPSIAITSTPPIVVVPFETGNNGALSLGRADAFAILGGTTRQVTTNTYSMRSMLSELSRSCPHVWIAPRALDLLDFMVGPRHCVAGKGN